MSLAKKAGNAGALLFLRKMWGAFVNLGVMAYLARTLNQSDFGLVAISGVLISFIQVFALSGIGEYVVFYQGKDQKKVQNSAFWLNLILTFLVTLVVLIVAPFWAKSYDDPRIIKLVWLLLVGFIFSSLSSLPNALFQKELNYAPMIKVKTIFGTLAQLSQVLFAFLGFGVYSLALPNAIIVPLMAITLFFISGFRPQKSVGKKYWKKIFAYTKNVTGARVLSKFANEGDTLLIGKLLGMGALGIYDIAFKLSNLINRQLVPIVTNVALPVFSKKQKSIAVTRNHFMKMIKLLATLFFPIYLGLIFFASEVVHFLYGQKWNDAIELVKVLSFFAMFRAISSPTSGLYNALGRPQIGFYFTLIFTPLFLLVLYFSLSYGSLFIACIAVTILRVLGSFVHFYIGGKLLQYTLYGFFRNIYPVLLSGSIVIISYFFVIDSSFFIKLLVFLLAWIIPMRFVFKEYTLSFFSMLIEILPFNIKLKKHSNA